MTTFNYNGYEFEGLQTEKSNIVWFVGNPNDYESLPRSFDFDDVVDSFLVHRELPNYNEVEA